MKMDINIHIRKELSRKCHLCERDVYNTYYDLDVDWEDSNGNYGRYRHLCPDCHCALKKHFTGVD